MKQRGLRVFAKFNVENLLERIRVAFFDAEDEANTAEFDAFTYPPGQAPIFGVSKAALLKAQVWQQFNSQLEELGLAWVSVSVTGKPATLKIGVVRYEGLRQGEKETP